ncbi:MAG: hypothetical protein ACE5FY_01780 [Nitrospiria bacterium]
MNDHPDRMAEKNDWKRCSNCKKEIPFSGRYYLCSVSTCRRKKTGLFFCSVSCWDAHLGFANHRRAYAEEDTAPSRKQFETFLSREAQPDRSEQPGRRFIRSSGNQQTNRSQAAASKVEVDTLVVVSKVKKLIQETSGFKTSQCAIDALTKKVVDECLKAMEHATASERKTVMGRDIF